MKHILIDGDPLIYRSCLTTDAATLDEHIEYFESILDYILWDINPFPMDTDYTVFLSGATNYRKQIWPDYKANRSSPKPSFLGSVIEHAAENHPSVMCDGYEADDGISMACHERGFKNVIIVSSDKDFKQLPVELYNTYHWKRETVSRQQATINLWMQVLTGDNVDNIKGAKGIGVKKAQAILKGLRKKDDLEAAVRQTFLDIDPDNGEKDFEKAYTLVKLLSNKKELKDILEKHNVGTN